MLRHIKWIAGIILHRTKKTQNETRISQWRLLTTLVTLSKGLQYILLSVMTSSSSCLFFLILLHSNIKVKTSNAVMLELFQSL